MKTKRRGRLTICTDVSTGQFLVDEEFTYGFFVLGRFDTLEEARAFLTKLQISLGIRKGRA